MGVKERKAREKEQLKNRIINTATDMFVKEGYDSTSIRKIAANIEYSPATLYLYFEDKDQLFYHIQERAFTQFTDKLNEFSFIKDPLGRLKSISNSYVEFAMEQPGLYKLMFIEESPLKSLDHLKNWTTGSSCYQMLKETITACNEKNLLKKMPPDESTLLFWSFLHGLASLGSSGRLAILGDKEFLRTHIKACVERMISVMQFSYV